MYLRMFYLASAISSCRSKWATILCLRQCGWSHYSLPFVSLWISSSFFSLTTSGFSCTSHDMQMRTRRACCTDGPVELVRTSVLRRNALVALNTWLLSVLSPWHHGQPWALVCIRVRTEINDAESFPVGINTIPKFFAGSLTHSLTQSEISKSIHSFFFSAFAVTHLSFGPHMLVVCSMLHRRLTIFGSIYRRWFHFHFHPRQAIIKRFFWS